MAEVARNPNASRPPSGNPKSALTPATARSLVVHFSSTPPEEKKNTSYGVIADANSAIATKKYVGQFSPAGGLNVVACALSDAKSGLSQKMAITSTTSESPVSP